MAAFKTQKEKMDDQRSYLVVKDNALIQKAKYNLTANEQKLVNYVITMIKPGEEEFKKYEIRALDFARLCGISALSSLVATTITVSSSSAGLTSRSITSARARSA